MITQEDKRVITTTVRETLKALGIDACDPLEMQRDFAYIRQRRLSSARITTGFKLSTLGTLFVALVGGVGWLLKKVISE